MLLKQNVWLIVLTTILNKEKQRIKNNELLRYEFVDRYKNIVPCLLLYFETEPKIRPIRAHRFEEYEAIFKKFKLK